MSFPHDYAERVYAGVLGKVIGVYLGRLFEGWTHEHIMANLGEIKYYVNDRANCSSKPIPLSRSMPRITPKLPSGRQ
jgi:hypothetical protein